MKKYWNFLFYNIFSFYYNILRFFNCGIVVFLTKLLRPQS